MRKLASIEVIDKLEPIPNADKILKATIKGWECVVAKVDNFKVGDKVIFSKYAGAEVKYRGEEYMIMHQGEILAVIE